MSLTPLPMFHIGGIGWAYLGLVNGATTILVSDFDAAEVIDVLERERVTNAVFVPTILQMLAGVPERPSAITRVCVRSPTGPRRSPRRC